MLGSKLRIPYRNPATTHQADTRDKTARIIPQRDMNIKGYAWLDIARMPIVILIWKP